MSNVTITLAQLLAILDPPEHVETVPQYRDHVKAVLAPGTPPGPSPALEAGRGPGRPMVYKHPAYSEAQYRAIKTWVEEELADYPDNWEHNGKKAKTLAREQPDDETLFRLDNGLLMSFSERFKFDRFGKILAPSFPPVAVVPD